MTATAPAGAPPIAVVAAETEAAQQALTELSRLYPCVAPERAEIVVSLGGDGFMLGRCTAFCRRGCRFTACIAAVSAF